MSEVFEQSIEQLNAHNQAVIRQFRETGGVVDAMPDGVRPLLLTITGAKTGKQRVVPLGCFVIDGALVICAAFGGAPRNPVWVSSLRKEPHVRVELGKDVFDAIAHEVPLSRHEYMWAQLLAATDKTMDPRAKTTRTIPLFELTRTHP